MDTTTLSYALIAFVVSAFLKGITGLGFSTICLGILTIFIDIKIAIPLVLIPSLSSNVLVMVSALRFWEAVKRFHLVYATVIPGVVIGLWLLYRLDSTIARTCLGAVLLLYGIWGLLNLHHRITERQERRLAVPVGFVNGIVNGLTGSQVMPLLPYLLALNLDKDVFVQTINISFTISSLVMILGLSGLGYLNWPIAGASTLGIAPVALGIWLGSKVRRVLPEAVFRRLVLGMLVVLGSVLVLNV